MTPQAKTLAEIKDEYAKEQGCKNYESFRGEGPLVTNMEAVINGIAERYADQFRNEWISVEDTLPPVMEYILTWHPDHGKDIAYRLFSRGHANMPAQHFKDKGVTHWQPLPSPPEK